VNAGQAVSWVVEYEHLSAADRSEPLVAVDLERLATAAFMLGLAEEYFALLERAYEAHLAAGEGRAALRCAFWIGVNLAQRGEMGRAGGWLGRAERLLNDEGRDCVEAGYLLLPLVFRHAGSGDLEAAAVVAGEAAVFGERFGDRDLFALAAHEHGHLLIQLGRREQGVSLLDEAMLAAVDGELSPIATGIVYCGAILACDDAHDLHRAREWTAALSEWCARQPDLVAFTGRCLVHRAQIMVIAGQWRDAEAEARRATERCLRGENPAAAGEACYVCAEIARLRGDFAAAENAYREATSHGRDPQPGLALLRLAQGDTQSADAAIRRAEAAGTEPATRARILPAYVEIMVAADDLKAAAAVCDELESLGHGHERDPLTALAAHARGATTLAAGDARAAMGPLRRAFEIWHQLDASYEAARSRELLGQAYRELGDVDTAMFELEAAHQTFATLGAATDETRVGLLLDVPRTVDRHGLSERELEVLQHLAIGETNKMIASALVLSTRTVDRHVSNIYSKLGVSTRAAATAYAHKHALV
jgi:ATP/maltotriose-dependent transcriptional regulator MalT